MGDGVRECLFILKANTLEISDYCMKNFRALPLHPIDGAGVTHLSITAMQKSLSAYHAILSDESDGSEGGRTAVTQARGT